MTRWTRLPALAAVLVLLLPACGGDDDAGEESAQEMEQEQEREAEAEGEGAEGACEGEALAADATGLPADFPMPSGLVLVDSGEAGPSATADGYFDGGLESAYETMKSELEGAGYKITFDEIERDDAEITYESADGASTGIVELRMRCGSEDRAAVHVTNRPA